MYMYMYIHNIITHPSLSVFFLSSSARPPPLPLSSLVHSWLFTYIHQLHRLVQCGPLRVEWTTSQLLELPPTVASTKILHSVTWSFYCCNLFFPAMVEMSFLTGTVCGTHVNMYITYIHVILYTCIYVHVELGNIIMYRNIPCSSNNRTIVR